MIEHANNQGLTQDDASKAFYFSYLLTVTDAPATKKWLKLETDASRGTVRSVDGEKLKRLWTWLYGSKQDEASPAISESRQIHKLNRVLAVKEATKELEKTGNLERAFAYTKTREEYVSEVLGTVRSDLQDMFTTVFPEGPLVENGKNKEQIASAKQEFHKIETVLASIKPHLGL